MKTKLPAILSTRPAFALVAAVLSGLATHSVAGEKSVAPAPVVTQGGETAMDIPSDFHKYYGQRVNNYRDAERMIARIDLDGDLNADGVISNTDPADGGAFEGTPPGLQVGVGEMTKVVLRVTPYRVDFDGEVVVSLEVAGINRGDKTGQFASFDDEVRSTGRVRVWKDPAKKLLLLDSADPNRRYVEWSTQYREYPYNLPGTIPRVFYVEGVKSSNMYQGDIRLLVSCAHRKPGTTPETYVESRKKLLKSFRTSFDHMLFTVRPQPIEKEYVNNNAEGVWLGAPAPSSK
ncbi:MAG: hypothetical protein KDK97_03630 [Verrucomicrobiales bacterium]|nr:hypothetical protein [Verrucomicrobiales bacterium]MCP5559307.1 hypothetical protein [Verrucomicrobiaceae bacterium]